jgi:hypothetical protein
MNRKWIYLAMAGALIAGAKVANAQRGGPDGPGGPIGPRLELLGFGEMHPGKVVTGAPFSGTGVTEETQTLADGNTINRKVQSSVYRDSQGRTRRETTFSGVGAATTSTTKTAVMIHDPVAGTAFVLHSDTKVAEQLPARKPNANTTSGTNTPEARFEAHIQAEIANGTLKKEDLGTQTINGVTAQGTRYIRTIPAGQIGNTTAITVTNEQWYSPDLQVVVKSTRSDPRMGTVTYTLTNIQRTEPAASLFTVPTDYTVKPANARRGRGPGGPPPAGDVAPPPPQE